MTEKIMVPTAAANKAFDNYNSPLGRELEGIPGFTNPDTHFNRSEADSGRIPALFLITRISDGKLFAAEYNEAADDNFYASAPFFTPETHSQIEGEIEFREVEMKTRTIVQEYYEFK